MKAWDLEDIRRAVTGKWLMRPEKMLRKFTGRVSTDSRKAAAGDLFIAIKGERFDAHEFLGDVIARDVAVAILHTPPPADVLARARERDVSLILVDDTIAALNRLAAAYRANTLTTGFRAKVIAVGGSNGKTTTKRIIHALLAEKFGEHAGHASPASFNNNIGMPLTLLDTAPTHEYVVVEIGTNAPGEIRALAEVCRPDVAVITSIGMEHLEKLINLAGVAREEAAVAECVSPSGMIVMPAGVPELTDALKASKIRRILVGRDDAAADMVARDIRETLEGTTFTTNTRNTFRVPLLGEHNAINTLMAIAVARRFGVTDEQIATGLAKVKPADGRMQLLHIGSWTVIHDAYNANPTSMVAALQTFGRMAHPAPKSPDDEYVESDQRFVLILADMLELGPDTDEFHRTMGQIIGVTGYHMFIAIGPSMQHAAKAAESCLVKTHWFESAAAANEQLLSLLEPNDAILLKGSHGMHLETLLETLKSGNHKAVSAAH